LSTTCEIPRVLYVAYWGAAEPLGQSLILPAVKKLAASGVELVLVTFEKPKDLADRDGVARIRDSLKELGVRWQPLRYHKRPKLPATTFDLVQGFARGLFTNLKFPFNIVHARTYVGGLMGLAIARLHGAKYIFHNEGFYPDEQVDGGVWRNGSFAHCIARSLEQRMYAAADGIITLSYRAQQVVNGLPDVRRRGTPTIVVPSCVDLEQFRWAPTDRAERTDEIRLAYIGSIGHRYIFDRIGRFVAVACRELRNLRLRVLTRTDPAVVDTMLRDGGVPEGAWSVASVPHAAVPGELRAQHAGLFFLTNGLSEHGCSPTKIGEYWASGLPVITTPNVSDTDDIIRRHRVGVIVGDHTDTEYRRAARELRELLDDPELPRRCRAAAESHYNLDAACARQAALYSSMLQGLRRSPTIRSTSIQGTS
jgi:glycosyltransferase involved in cell wall biosynthesis